MFSLQIVDTDAFLDMPTSSQLLYFHLCMRADDEGFVGNPKKIMRIIGANDDDYKLLIAKRFVLIFESSVMVIKHWLIHNTIRMDRFNPTTYQDEKNLLQLKENKSYTLESGNQLATSGRHKLSKVKLSKVNLTTEQSSEGKEISEIIFLFKEVNPTIEKYYGNTSQRAAVKRMLKAYTREKLEVIIKALPEVNKRQYWPKSTTPCQLENNLPIYKAKNDEEKAKVGKNIIGIAI